MGTLLNIKILATQSLPIKYLPNDKIHLLISKTYKRQFLGCSLNFRVCFIRNHNFFLSSLYEGRSICNENSPVYPKFLYITHFIVTFIERSLSLLNKCKIAVVQLLILLNLHKSLSR